MVGYFSLVSEVFFTGGRDFTDDGIFAGVTDSLRDFTHLQKLFSTGPTVEDFIRFKLLNFLFALIADPLGDFVD